MPGWVHTLLFVVGIASALVLAGPFAVLFGLLGSIAFGSAFNYLGGKWFGEGSDGQKWMALGGSILGGIVCGSGGAKLDSKYVITAEGLGANGGNLRIRPRTQNGQFASEPRTGDIVHNRASEYPHGNTPAVREKVITDATRSDGSVIGPDKKVIPPDQVTIEHDPPVVEHWNTKGYNQTQAERNSYYNDPTNLSVMSKNQNSSEGATNGQTYRQDVGPNYKP